MTGVPLDLPGAGTSRDWHGPVEVRAALEPYATDAVLAAFDDDLDAAYGVCVGTGELGALRTFLDKWWNVADVAKNGMPPGRRTGGSAEQFRRDGEQRHGRPLPGAPCTETDSPE